jgi:hypothetical protein
MSLFRPMDVYKGIVLMSAVVLPLGWWWISTLDENIRLCRNTISESTKPGGLLEQIGGLQKKVEVVVQNRRNTSDAIKAPGTYFAGQILAAGGAGIKQDDFTLPTEPKEEAAVTGSAKQKASDYVAEISWKRSDLAVQMGFIFAVLFNCESGARMGGEQVGQQSVWKLRELNVVNATDERLVTGKRTPPAELQDKWSIKKMTFARREPKKGT